MNLLIKLRAHNVHMGTSPYYRGPSCSFGAPYDGKPEYVGATIHLLTRGLDSGPMLCYDLPTIDDGDELDGFALGMRAVRVALDTLSEPFQDSRWRSLTPIQQDQSLGVRCTRNQDVTDGVDAECLSGAPAPDAIREAMRRRDDSGFILADFDRPRRGGPRTGS